MLDKLKVLLVNKNLMAGGIETAMLSFITEMHSYIDIDVFLFNKTGILLDRLPQDIKVYEGGKLLQLTSTNGQVNNTKKGRMKKILFSVLKKLGAKQILKRLCFVSQKLEKQYDVVISMNGLDELCSSFALKCCTAKRKISFIHSDMSQYRLSQKTLKRLNKFDKLISVSKSCAQIFKENYPQLVKKIDYLYNFQDVDRIIEMSKIKAEDFSKKNDCLNIVSVSRLSEEKGFLRSLKILKKLADEGKKFFWHIIGDGDELTKIIAFIKDNKMEDFVKLYGNKGNPYPYIKEADVFYLGSFHEAAPMVYFESMILHTPIITTKTSSSKEIVGDLGVVCDNDEQGIYKMFDEIINNKNIIRDLRMLLKNYSYNCDENIKRTLNLFN